jgi:hypothetical protein
MVRNHFLFCFSQLAKDRKFPAQLMGALSLLEVVVSSLQNAKFSGIALLRLASLLSSLSAKEWHTIWSRFCSCIENGREFGGEGSVVVEEREEGRESRAPPFM